MERKKIKLIIIVRLKHVEGNRIIEIVKMYYRVFAEKYLWSMLRIHIRLFVSFNVMVRAQRKRRCQERSALVSRILSQKTRRIKRNICQIYIANLWFLINLHSTVIN